jgi:hypothetical protein
MIIRNAVYKEAAKKVCKYKTKKEFVYSLQNIGLPLDTSSSYLENMIHMIRYFIGIVYSITTTASMTSLSTCIVLVLGVLAILSIHATTTEECSNNNSTSCSNAFSSHFPSKSNTKKNATATNKLPASLDNNGSQNNVPFVLPFP